MKNRPVQIPFVELKPQNFTTPNYGQYFVPSIQPHAAMQLAAAAMPRMGRPMNVHTAPVSYTRPGVISRVLGGIGFTTKQLSGGGLNGI